MDSTFLVRAVMPLEAASIVLMPEAIESRRLPISAARLFRAEAVKKFDGLSRAEFTLLPVARRLCVLSIMPAVFWRLKRFARTAFERETSEPILGFPSGRVVLSPQFLRHLQNDPDLLKTS